MSSSSTTSVSSSSHHQNGGDFNLAHAVLDSNSATTATTTRLMITKMILENFKSYAGVQEIGPFHKRFSSIIGPNGSGKSNVIDALLFVFGKRAKQLRLNKVSELIHKSSQHTNLEYAKVEIYFQLINDNENSEDDYEIISGSEFIVSRIAYKNNQSKYSINGLNSSYTEVGTLLRQHGIDLDNNRFLILQGEVEQIAMMKPKAQQPNEDGLLEYLEDIIGSNQYVNQIEELSKLVEQFNEQRVEKVKRLQISQNEREGLERPRAEAVAYLERESNIRHKNNLLYQIYLNDCDVNIDALSMKLQGYQERLKEEKQKLSETEKVLKGLEKNYQQILNEYEQLTSEMQKTAEDFTAYERRDTKMIEDMKYIKSEIQKLQTNIKKESTKEKEAITLIAQYQNEITDLRNDLAAIQIRKEKAEKHLDEVMGSLQESTASLRIELEQAQVELTESDRNVSEIQTEKESIETAIKLVDSRVQSSLKAIETTETRLQSLENEESEIHSGRSSKDSLRKKLISRRDALTQTIQNHRQKQTDLQARIRQAVSVSEESKAAMQAQQTSPGAVRPEIVSILKQTKPGGCLAGVGVRGRLGDLGAINNEYDVAISTACSCLDFIVVDSNDAAGACIDYLKATNSGRASFIVLDQLGHSTAKMDAPLRVPEGTQRLFDLIRPKDPTFRPAFYMALRDTLVTDDWDLATRVAYDGDRVRWRIVTTTGNLIDTSGSMTGGGKPPSSGGMKANSSKAEVTITQDQINQFDADVANLQTELGQCRTDIATSEKELKEIENQLKQLQMELEKSDLQLSRISSEKQDLRSRLSTLQSSCTMTREEIAEKKTLERKLSEICRRIDEMSPNRSQLQGKVKEIQQRILDVGGPGLKRAQAKVDSTSSEYAACQGSLSAKEVAISSTTKQQTKASNLLSKAENDLKLALERKANLEQEQQEMESEAAEVLKAQERAKHAALAKEKELKEFTVEYRELEETVKVIKEVEVDLRSNYDNCNKLLKENESKRSGLMKELNKVRKHHDEDIKEFRVFFELPVISYPNGEEETKEVDSEPQANQPISEVLQPLQVYTPQELVETLGISLDAPVRSQPAPSNKRGKGRKQIETNEDEDGTSDDPKKHAIDKLKGEINMMEADRDRLKSAVNMTSLLEYKKKDEEFRSRLEELEDVTTKRNNARKDYEDLRRKRLEEFMTGFGIITLKLKEMYQMITLGGDAELELVDSLDPFSEGIVFSVRPPKKSWKNISNLSGGEKTLSSLALVFALHHFKPTPLYVMDEIDAALDFKNVSIVANYIKQRTKNAQFVIISLRNNMFELANRLVGIYKTNDTTKSVTINPHCFENIPTLPTPSQTTTATVTTATNTFSSQSNEEEETTSAGTSDQISSSPLPKKFKQNKKISTMKSDNDSENISTQKLSSRGNASERKAVLADSTNKI